MKKELDEIRAKFESRNVESKAQAAEVAKLREQLGIKNKELQDQRVNLKENSSKSQTFDQEKLNMSNMLLSKQQEIARLNQELTDNAAQLTDLKVELRSEKARNAEFQALEFQSKSVILTTQQELVQAKKSIAWLNEELARKSDQLGEYRREKSDQIAALQTELENNAQERSSLEVRNQLLQKRADELEQKFSAKIDQLREVITIDFSWKIARLFLNNNSKMKCSRRRNWLIYT